MITLTARAMRISNDALRTGVLFLLFIPDVLPFFLCALFNARQRRLFGDADFWWQPVDVFLAGMRGEFLGRTDANRG
jgi:hypothetical protein